MPLRLHAVICYFNETRRADTVPCRCVARVRESITKTNVYVIRISLFELGAELNQKDATLLQSINQIGLFFLKKGKLNTCSFNIMKQNETLAIATGWISDDPWRAQQATSLSDVIPSR